MKILFIGGTIFVGRQMVEDALAQGHEVHLLHRGKSHSELFKGITKYIGDRADIACLIPATESFDMVIDTCGYHPEIVGVSCEFLRKRTGLYVFVSTGSVYSDFSIVGLNEFSNVHQLTVVPPPGTKRTPENYGPLKVLCEKKVIEYFGTEKSLILRPGIIVGPYDDSNRLDYWIKSILNNKELNVPQDEAAMIQFIDVRALSYFVLNAMNTSNRGLYNLVGPKTSIRFIEFIEKAKKLLNPQLSIIQIPSSEISDDNKFPMYTNHPDWKGFFRIDGSKAYRNGLIEVDVSDTILKTADYLKTIQ